MLNEKDIFIDNIFEDDVDEYDPMFDDDNIEIAYDIIK